MILYVYNIKRKCLSMGRSKAVVPPSSMPEAVSIEDIKDSPNGIGIIQNVTDVKPFPAEPTLEPINVEIEKFNKDISDKIAALKATENLANVRAGKDERIKLEARRHELLIKYPSETAKLTDLHEFNISLTDAQTRSEIKIKDVVEKVREAINKPINEDDYNVTEEKLQQRLQQYNNLWKKFQIINGYLSGNKLGSDVTLLLKDITLHANIVREKINKVKKLEQFIEEFDLKITESNTQLNKSNNIAVILDNMITWYNKNKPFNQPDDSLSFEQQQKLFASWWKFSNIISAKLQENIANLDEHKIREQIDKLQAFYENNNISGQSDVILKKSRSQLPSANIVHDELLEKSRKLR